MIKKFEKLPSRCLRISIAIINLCLMFSFGLYHYYTNTIEFQKGKMMLKDSLYRKMPQLLLKNLYLSKTCDDKNSLQLYTWPGTNSGCICRKDQTEPESQKLTDYNFYANCPGNKVRCVQVFNIPYTHSQRLNKFTEGYKFCFEKYKKEDILSEKNCENKPEMKSCFEDLCVKKDLKCPVTDFSFAEASKNKILIKREAKPGLIGIKASLNGLPCINRMNSQPRKTNFIKFQDYPYLRVKAEGCKIGSDESAKKIIEFKEKDFYIENGMEELVEEQLFFYKNFLESEGNSFFLWKIKDYGFKKVSLD